MELGKMCGKTLTKKWSFLMKRSLQWLQSWNWKTENLGSYTNNQSWKVEIKLQNNCPIFPLVQMKHWPYWDEKVDTQTERKKLKEWTISTAQVAQIYKS